MAKMGIKEWAVILSGIGALNIGLAGLIGFDLIAQVGKIPKGTLVATILIGASGAIVVWGAIRQAMKK